MSDRVEQDTSEDVRIAAMALRAENARLTQAVQEWLDKTPADLVRAVRSLKYQKRQLGKQLGAAGRTIFQLRNEVAALREAVQWNPGDRARLLRENTAVIIENRRLKEKLAAAEGVDVAR